MEGETKIITLKVNVYSDKEPKNPPTSRETERRKTKPVFQNALGRANELDIIEKYEISLPLLRTHKAVLLLK